MIVELFLALIFIFVYSISRVLVFLGDATLPEGFTNAFAQVGDILAPIAHVIDLFTLFFLIGLIVSIELGYLLWKGINWLIRKLPTIS